MKMKKVFLIPLLGLALSGSAFAESVTTRQVPAVVDALKTRYKVPSAPTAPAVQSLNGLVELQRRHWPSAVVTSGFYDWRTVSQYRSRAGLHLGYDIAMPYGVPVSAGWGGTVVSVANWSGAEYGITVRSSDGTEVTYGHLSPSVSVGDAVNAGDVIGTIASDHVDVKMQDGSGSYVAFGEGETISAAPVQMVGREGFLVSWLVARNSLELAQDELDRIDSRAARDKLELQQLKTRLPKLEETVKLMDGYVASGLVARKTAEQARLDLADARKRIGELSKVGDGSRKKQLTRQVAAARNRVASVEREAGWRGYRWTDVEAFVNQTVAADGKLSKVVTLYKQEHGPKRAEELKQLTREVEEGRTRLKGLEELFEMGGLSKNDLDTARERQKLLEKELAGLRANGQ